MNNNDKETAKLVVYHRHRIINKSNLLENTISCFAATVALQQSVKQSRTDKSKDLVLCREASGKMKLRGTSG